MTRLNAKNSFGLLNLKNDKNTWINVICGILLIVLIVLLIICLVKGKDSFGDTNKDTIKMYGRKGCPFVDRAKAKHKENNNTINGISIEYIDISHPSAKDHGITGTPSYVLGDKIVTGFHDDDMELYKKLTEGNDKKDKDNNMGENVVTMYGSNGCPFCMQAKKLLDSKKIKYNFVDSTSDVAKAMTAYGGSGVPLTVVLKKNGEEETIHGFDEEKLNKIK